MMYHFTDIRDASRSRGGLGMVFNGQYLLARMNNANGSFKVLTVSGRGLLAQHHQTTDVVGRHGKYFHRKTYESRELVVKVLLEGNNDLAYRKQYELLNTLLDSPEPAYLRFSDEVDRFYLAQFKEAETGEEVANRTVLNLSFVCYDPFKYSAEKTQTGANVATLTKTFATDVAIKPIIRVKIKSGNPTYLRILHVAKGQYIRIDLPTAARLKANDVVVFDCQTGSVTVNGTNALQYLDMVNSRFFTLVNGSNRLTANVALDWEIVYREVYR